MTLTFGAPQLVGNQESSGEADSHPEPQVGGCWRACGVLTEGISEYHGLQGSVIGLPALSLTFLFSCFSPPGSPHSSCSCFLFADLEHAKYTSTLPPRDLCMSRTYCPEGSSGYLFVLCPSGLSSKGISLKTPFPHHCHSVPLSMLEEGGTVYRRRRPGALLGSLRSWLRSSQDSKRTRPHME